MKSETFDFLAFLAHGGYPTLAASQASSGPRKGEVWETGGKVVVILKEFENVSTLWSVFALWVHDYPLGPSYLISRNDWDGSSPKKLTSDIPEMEAREAETRALPPG